MRHLGLFSVHRPQKKDRCLMSEVQHRSMLRTSDIYLMRFVELFQAKRQMSRI